MIPPEGFEHLGQDFWDRVEPDPNSDCLIYHSEAMRPSHNGRSLVSFLTGGSSERHYRACRRRMCANPDHLQQGNYPMQDPYPKRPFRQGRWTFDRQYRQC